jgi:hypothetical protein
MFIILSSKNYIRDILVVTLVELHLGKAFRWKPSVRRARLPVLNTDRLMLSRHDREQVSRLRR